MNLTFKIRVLLDFKTERKFYFKFQEYERIKEENVELHETLNICKAQENTYLKIQSDFEKLVQEKNNMESTLSEKIQQHERFRFSKLKQISKKVSLQIILFTALF